MGRGEDGPALEPRSRGTRTCIGLSHEEGLGLQGCKLEGSPTAVCVLFPTSWALARAPPFGCRRGVCQELFLLFKSLVDVVHSPNTRGEVKFLRVRLAFLQVGVSILGSVRCDQ